MRGDATRKALIVNDPILDPLLGAKGPEVQREIERLLVGHAQPLIARILARQTREGSAVTISDTDDLAATITLRVIERLRRLAEMPAEGLHDFESYVATLAHNALNDHFRRRFPRRTALKDRLRYVLSTDDRLSLWNTPRGLACGLAGWKSVAHLASAVPLDPRRATAAMRDRRRDAEALVEIFRAAGGPVAFDALVSFTAELWQVADALVSEAADANETALGAQLENRDFLKALWREIRALRAPQRKALLLNLRDAESTDVIGLLVLTGTAKVDELAAALELTPEQLAELWNELPLSDLRIGALLGMTRQQVINLRKAARTRLARRMAR